MPQDNQHGPNGKTPKLSMPEGLHFERDQVICQQCHRIFEHFVIEEIDKLRQLRIGDLLVVQAEMRCLHCGKVFRWDMNDKKLEEMSVVYGAIVKRIYSAE